MSVFDGLNYGTEKTPVIFDIGQLYTKCGFAGDSGPHVIVPSVVTRPKSGETVNVHSAANDAKELYGVLVDFIYHVYIRVLSVNPKDRRVVVVENMLTTTSVFRETLAAVLFKHYEVSSVAFAPSHVVCLYTLGVRSALVVDLGSTHSTVVPVYEWIPIIKAWQSLPVAAQSIHSKLSSQLMETSNVVGQNKEPIPLPNVMENIPEKLLEDIKVRCCFVTKFSRAEKLRSVATGETEPTEAPVPPPAVEYPLKGTKILQLSGNIRETACEVLFESDCDGNSLASAILDSILLCPIDVRQMMAGNILLTGGTAMLPGLKHRLQEELKALVSSPAYEHKLAVRTFKFHKAPGRENYLSWLGGSIYGSLETLSSRSILRDVYMSTTLLPDWCSLYQPDEKPAILGATKKLEGLSSSPLLSPSLARTGLLTRSASSDSRSPTRSPVVARSHPLAKVKASSMGDSHA